MAEKKAKAAKPKAKKARAAPAKKTAKAAARKPAAKKKAAPRAKAAPRRVARSASTPFDIAKLIDHPLVADLLAVGAMAAVAAIADHSVKSRTGESEKGSSKAVKAAGKAAAAAVGKRLLTEVDAIKKASKGAGAKRGSK